jgi:outer membrane protein OmpA-like peptidoglycan-associated protein
MIITASLSEDGKLTEEQKKEIEEAKKFPITFDEDSPEMTPEMEKAFKVAARMRNRLKA